MRVLVYFYCLNRNNSLKLRTGVTVRRLASSLHWEAPLVGSEAAAVHRSILASTAPCLACCKCSVLVYGMKGKIILSVECEVLQASFLFYKWRIFTGKVPGLRLTCLKFTLTGLTLPHHLLLALSVWRSWGRLASSSLRAAVVEELDSAPRPSSAGNRPGADHGAPSSGLGGLSENEQQWLRTQGSWPIRKLWSRGPLMGKRPDCPVVLTPHRDRRFYRRTSGL